MNRIRRCLRSVFLSILCLSIEGISIRNGKTLLSNCVRSRGGSSAAGAGATSKENDENIEAVEISMDENLPSEDEEDEEPSFQNMVGNEDEDDGEEKESRKGDDESEDESSSSLDSMSPGDEMLSRAASLRQEGKVLHDQGNLELAANLFSDAANLLKCIDSESQGELEEKFMADYCTCRLHEALCRLKMEDFESCIDVCTSVLELEDTSPAVRSRAHHRRAKAHLQLGNEEEALEDARTAAFLGDRKAVALYGKLMRGSGSEEDSIASPPMLRDLLQGKNPFLQSATGENAGIGSPASILEPLLGKSDPSMLMAEAPSLLGKGGTGGSLAKSLLSSLTKRLESDPDRVCDFFQNINPTQLQSYLSLAGVPISADQATKLTELCHKVTPKRIQSTIKLSKGVWYTLTIFRKTRKVINKYKHLLILWGLVAWIQSAIKRPIPISKKAARMAATAATKGLQ